MSTWDLIIGVDFYVLITFRTSKVKTSRYRVWNKEKRKTRASLNSLSLKKHTKESLTFHQNYTQRHEPHENSKISRLSREMERTKNTIWFSSQYLAIFHTFSWFSSWVNFPNFSFHKYNLSDFSLLQIPSRMRFRFFEVPPFFTNFKTRLFFGYLQVYATSEKIYVEQIIFFSII